MGIYDTIHWFSIRRQARKRANGRCEDCGEVTFEFHVHHLTYARKGQELLTDVMAICLPCHEKCHPGRIFVPLAEQRRRALARGKTIRPNTGLSKDDRRDIRPASQRAQQWSQIARKRLKEGPGDIRERLIASYDH